MYTCKYFAIHELVPKRIFEERGELAWELLDDRALKTLDALRDRYGKMTVNNYYWGGDRQWSGLRTQDSPYGSEISQHRFGRAFDSLFHEIDVNHARDEILANPDLFPYIRSLELDTSWLHFDTRNCARIKTYNPYVPRET